MAEMFTVEQYEVHVTTYVVYAEDKADAISQVFDGGGEIINSEYLETDENRGMSTGELTRKEADILELGSISYVPGIRSIKERD